MVADQDYWTQLSTTMTDKVIGKEYQLLEPLGRGSYGCLFLGQSLHDKTYVAVKILSKKGLDDEQLKLQQLEIDIQASLKHSHLLALHRTIHDQDYIFMVMELCDVGDLFDFVLRDGARGEMFVRSAFGQILDAVAYMHAHNVYHRDIKLENILLKSDEPNNELTCKVADFGLATHDRLSIEYGCGSTSYLAPEHFEEDVPATEEPAPYDTAASDVWSLGILLLALLFGRNPWQEATTGDRAFEAYKRDTSVLRQQLFPSLSPTCDLFLRKVLSVRPDDRPSVDEMKRQFAALDRLVDEVDDEDDYEEEDAWLEDTEHVPVNIPAAHPQYAKASFDSAIFSDTSTTGTSWSDMVEQDEEDARCALSECHLPDPAPMCYVHDEDDPCMFVHTHEKESWWL